MALAPIILAVCCGVAFYRPVWGIAVLLAAECSIFFPGDNLAKVFLPVGTIGPSDVLIVVLLLGALRQRKRRPPQPESFPEEPGGRASQEPAAGGVATLPRTASPVSAAARRRFAKNALVAAVFPYVLWLCFCAVYDYAAGHGTEGTRVSVRSSIFNIVPWCLVPTVWILRHRARAILKIAFAVATATAFLHLAIQVLDVRSVMLRAYWLMYDPTREFFVYQQSAVRRGDLVRGLPQGVILMLYVFIFSFARYVTGKDASRNLRYLLAGVLQLLALVITVTRSLIALSVAGVLFTVFFGTTLRVFSRNMQRRVMAGLLFICMATAGFLVFMTPDYLDFWIRRIRTFESQRRIFSSTTVRGLNNLSSLEAIRDHAILGYGMNRYPEKYSLLEEGRTPSDIHPFLQIALFSGIVGAALAAWMLLTLVRRFWWGCRRTPWLRIRMLPYVAIFATNILVNSVGAGGTFLSRGLIAMALFIGLAAADFAAPPPRTGAEA